MIGSMENKMSSVWSLEISLAVRPLPPPVTCLTSLVSSSCIRHGDLKPHKF